MINKERVNFKPFEYPEAMKFIDAINHSYWLHSELNYLSDIQDYKQGLTDVERSVIKNTLLAISQIEVSVKSFWSDLYKHIPKPEFNAVGATFAESEVRHERAYSHLLEILNLNDSFEHIMEVPQIKNRIEYLRKYLDAEYKTDLRQFVYSLALFSIFTEYVSLFSQFTIMLSFNRFKNKMKDTANIVEWTSKEELLHGLFGMWVINQIKKEFPSWFTDAFYHRIKEVANKAYVAECGILDWIFEKGELDFLSKEALKEFIKRRINEALVQIDCEEMFVLDEALIEETNWFYEEIYTSSMPDFFYKKPTGYAQKTRSISVDDLF